VLALSAAAQRSRPDSRHKKGVRPARQGITRLRDIPDGFKLTENQKIQRQTAISGKPHIEKKALSRLLARLKHPIYFIDFETFGTAIPLF